MDEVITDEPGHRVVIKVDRPELTLAEMLRPPSGKGTPLHFHKMRSDALYDP